MRPGPHPPIRPRQYPPFPIVSTRPFRSSAQALSNSASVGVGGMVFVKYARDVKAIVVKLSRRGVPLTQINLTLDLDVSKDSLARWNSLYVGTRDVIRDPAFYADRGRPLAFTLEEAEFVLTALDHEPDLYLDEIQSFITAMTGTTHPLATISDELKNRLHLTKKKARTVNPAQCPMKRAGFITQIGPIPSNYLVFIGQSS
ncbi:hypothetical protein MJO29_006515 [Puccinia striiformis f. sp. tritici]|nr:hypothetical protein MJO29_006515 [Puccinia striiformis f. sp. tritici]